MAVVMLAISVTISKLFGKALSYKPQNRKREGGKQQDIKWQGGKAARGKQQGSTQRSNTRVTVRKQQAAWRQGS